VKSVNIVELETMHVSELREMARDKDVVGYSRLKKQDLISSLVAAY